MTEKNSFNKKNAVKVFVISLFAGIAVAGIYIYL